MTRCKSHILFLIFDLGLTIENSSVFQAQVVDQVIALKRLGYNVALLCATNDRFKFHSVAGHKLEEQQVAVHLIPDAGFLKNIFTFAKALRNWSRSQEKGTIYIRGFWSVFPILLASPTRRLDYIYDVRGDIIDETTARGRRVHRLLLIRILETFALRRALYVTCVTKKLAAIIKDRARLAVLPEVIPSCIDLSNSSLNDDARDARRNELGYTDQDIVLVYSGGMAHYQMIPEMISLWRGLLSNYRRVKFLLLINSDPSGLNQSLGNLDSFAKHLKVMNLPRSEVFPTLCAADIGFLLREDRALNASASPVKFAEYLAAGLAVVSSPGLGDTSERIINYNLGLLVRPLLGSPEINKLCNFLNLYENDKAGFRERAIRTAYVKYNWLSYSKVYDKLYA